MIFHSYLLILCLYYLLYCSVLHAIQTFASKGALDDYLYVILPGLVRLCEQGEEPMNVRVDAVMTISKIARYSVTPYHDYVSITTCHSNYCCNE
jgi:hypothetical protein